MTHPSLDLANTDRPLISVCDLALPEDFSATLAARLQAAPSAPWAPTGSDLRDPASEGRMLEDDRPRARGPRGPRLHEVLVDWRAEDALVAMAGLRRSEASEHTLLREDGSPVDPDEAAGLVAGVSVEIAAAALASRRLDAAATVRLDDLLSACAVASGASLPGEILIAEAPSPWGPARLTIRSSDPGRDRSETAIDARIEKLLPIATSIRVVEEGGLDRIRVDARVLTIRHEDLPDPMETARILSEGWPA